MVIDEFIIMPNHVHGITFIVGAPLVGAHSVESRMGTKTRQAHDLKTGQAQDLPLQHHWGDVVGIFTDEPALFP